jgi:hypothetical protein
VTDDEYLNPSEEAKANAIFDKRMRQRLLAEDRRERRQPVERSEELDTDLVRHIHNTPRQLRLTAYTLAHLEWEKK